MSNKSQMVRKFSEEQTRNVAKQFYQFIRLSARQSVDSWFFGLIGATTAAYTTLFTEDAAVMSWSNLDMHMQLELALMVMGKLLMEQHFHDSFPGWKSNFNSTSAATDFRLPIIISVNFSSNSEIQSNSLNSLENYNLGCILEYVGLH